MPLPSASMLQARFRYASSRLTAAIEEGIPIQEPSRIEDYSGQLKLRIPKSLHKLLADHSNEEGISMNQYCLYLLSHNDALYMKN